MSFATLTALPRVLRLPRHAAAVCLCVYLSIGAAAEAIGGMFTANALIEFHEYDQFPPKVTQVNKTLESSVTDGIFSSNHAFGVELLNEGSVRGNTILGAAARGSAYLMRRTGGTELNLGLQAYAQASYADYAGIAYADVSWTFSDKVMLNTHGSDLSDASLQSLMFYYRITGDAWATLVGGRIAGRAALSFGERGQDGYVEQAYSNIYGVEDGLVGPFDAVIGVPVSLAVADNFLVGDYVVNGRAHSFADTEGSLEFAWHHTSTLIAVKFANGTTPEERGYTLEFESGLTSPNLVDHSDVAEVPEPSSLILLGTGAIGLIGVRRRRAAA